MHGAGLFEIGNCHLLQHAPRRLPGLPGPGRQFRDQLDLLGMPDQDMSLNNGAIAVTEWSGPREEGGYYWQTLEAAARSTASTWTLRHTIPGEKMDVVLYGTRPRSHRPATATRTGARPIFRTPFEGRISPPERRYNDQLRVHAREDSEPASERPCLDGREAPACAWKLRPSWSPGTRTCRLPIGQVKDAGIGPAVSVPGDLRAERTPAAIAARIEGDHRAAGLPRWTSG